MAVQKTIAFVGSKEEIPVFMQKLAQAQFRLLLILNEADGSTELVDKLKLGEDVELIDCPKHACWEADVIIITNLDKIEKLIDKIKQVATQKIVVVASEGAENKQLFLHKFENIEELLPNSKLLRISINSDEMKALVHGKDMEAITNFSKILESSGYEVDTKI